VEGVGCRSVPGGMARSATIDPGPHSRPTSSSISRGPAAALYRIVLVRLRHDQQTKDYMARRLKEGKSRKEIIRCLKRFTAREVFAVLPKMHETDSANAA
jgi:hypothetical protein